MGIGVVGMAAILPTDVVPSSLLPGLEKVKTLFLSVFFFYAYLYVERDLLIFSSLLTADRAISGLISALSLQTEALYQPNCKSNTSKPALCSNTMSYSNRLK